MKSICLYKTHVYVFISLNTVCTLVVFVLKKSTDLFLLRYYFSSDGYRLNIVLIPLSERGL